MKRVDKFNIKETTMQNEKLIKNSPSNEVNIKAGIGLVLFASLMLISNVAFAVDLLAGTDADIKDTMTGTGKHWLLWINGAISLATFAYTKKPMVFFSVLGVLLFITALVKMAA